jgi:hypothetical protein
LSRLLTFLATLRLVWECVLFYFLPFIMNLFVTRRSRSSWVVLPAACSVHPRQHVEASNNPSITLLPIRNVLILNRGYWSDCVNELCMSFCLDLNLCLMPWLAVDLSSALNNTGYFGSTPYYSCHLADCCSVSGWPAIDSPSSQSCEFELDVRL